MKQNSTSLITVENIREKILFIRGLKILLDRDLARLYGVETKRLKEAVKRNIDRFPKDFMFRLTKKEFENWRSQFASSNSVRMGLRYAPWAFTEQGVAMLSSVLKSKKAINVNIAIMRAFVELRKMIDANKELLKRIEKMEERYDEQFLIVFKAIKELMRDEEKPKRKIGF